MTKVPVSELTDCEIQFISLVDHGAIRDPFRIKKSLSPGGHPMIDLNRIPFFKKASAAPEVVFIAVSKAFGLEAAKAVLAKADVPMVGEPEIQDGGFLLRTAKFEDGSQILAMKVSDDMIIGVQNDERAAIEKSFSSYAWESTDFKTVFQQEGAMPMVGVACSALMDTIYNIMGSAPDQKTAGEQISKSLNDFGSVVLKTINSIPTSAFKLDQAYAEVVAVAKTEADASDPAPDVEVVEDPEAVEEPVEPVKKDDADIVPAATELDDESGPGIDSKDATGLPKGKAKKGEEAPAADPEVEPVVDPVTSLDLGPVMEAIQKMGASLGGQITALKTDLDATKTGLSTLQKALGSGTTGGDSEDDRSIHSKNETSEEDWESIDTAFAPLSKPGPR